MRDEAEQIQEGAAPRADEVPVGPAAMARAAGQALLTDRATCPTPAGAEAGAGPSAAGSRDPSPCGPAVPVTSRFAPTPSGRMHLGNVWSALVAWLSVRSAGGRMVVRIEDLDPRAADPETARMLLDDLRWLGLYWDEGPVYQHERLDLYEEALKRLEERGLTYPCFCTRAELHAASAPHASDGTPVYPGTCRGLTAEQVAQKARKRRPAVRLRVPGPGDPAGRIGVTDRVYGRFEQELARECGDFLVRRSDGVFAYQLAVVVDDAQMGVTEVVRGRDLLPSAPRQVYLQRLLGYPQPAYAHVPLLLSADGRRLSKRDRDVDMGELRARFCEAPRLLGALAYATGLAGDPRPVSAERLADSFSWDLIRAHAADHHVEPNRL